MNQVYRADYSNGRSSQHRTGLFTLSFWDDDWTDDENILDIGCGTGELTKLIASRDNVRNIVGIDISQAAINIANRDNSVTNKSRYIMADAIKLKETYADLENSFTKALALATIHWIEDKEKLFKIIYWSLKLSGGFIASIMIKHPKDTIVSVYQECSQLPRWKKYLQDFKCGIFPFNGKQRDLEEIIQRNGFKIHKIVRESLSHRLDSVDENKGFIKPLLGHLDYIPLELHDEFMEDVYQLFSSLAPKDEEGNSYWRFEAVFIKLEK
ncbi:juvenile hormone acid O-methyltransferase-like [Glandiceps talaboti]